MAVESSLTILNVSSLVWKPRITSTSFITVAGLKKCMPMNFPFRLTAEAISVMEIEEVLEAKIVSGLQIASSSWKTVFLTFRFSTIASTTRSASAILARSVVKEILESSACLAASSILLFATNLSRLLFSFASAVEMISSVMSRTTTSLPAFAKTWAISKPIVPAPIMAIFFMIVCFPPYAPNGAFFCLGMHCVQNTRHDISPISVLFARILRKATTNGRNYSL